MVIENDVLSESMELFAVFKNVLAHHICARETRQI